jgi:hypothetical protein
MSIKGFIQKDQRILLRIEILLANERDRAIIIVRDEVRASTIPWCTTQTAWGLISAPSCRRDRTALEIGADKGSGSTVRCTLALRKYSLTASPRIILR